MNYEILMQRCLDLAQKAKGQTAPNPMVGAVLVHNGCIIAEGWHKEYGGAHAEVDCLNNVGEADRPLVRESTMVVNLEPCAHTGKTPPCAARLVQERVKKVVIANTDPFVQVNGNGIALLRQAGIEVTTGVLQKEGLWVNRRFFCFHTLQRPYIILKWAQTTDGYFAPGNRSRFQVSNAHSQLLVHKWRSEEAAILVGATTAMNDNPMLTSRLWEGKQPLRIAISRNNELPADHHLLDGQADTWILNEHKNEQKGKTQYVKLQFDHTLPDQLMLLLHHHNILSLIIEGGAQLLERFIDRGLWDEARVFTGSMAMGDGITAPLLKNAVPVLRTNLEDDVLQVVLNEKSEYGYVEGMEM